MVEQLRGLKSLTRFVKRDQRAQVIELEQELQRIVAVVDEFYAQLGSRHWIFHESLNFELVEQIVKKPVNESEQALIAQYRDRETLRFQIQHLHGFPQLRPRMALIERARVDYEADRFYSSVLVLLPVMDGFVNDLEPENRRGLHTRSSDEMAAWDSVAGHHLGLSNAHRTFTKRFSKTSDEEVHELYRNGILHGTLTNFDNVVVATKAWNRLFAVADWASSREKQAREPEPEPTWRELFQQLRSNAAAKRALDDWQPRVLTKTDPDLRSEPLYDVAGRYLTAWGNKNYGEMAKMLSSLSREETHGKTAGRVRNECSLTELDGFDIAKLDFQAPAACEIDVELTYDGRRRPGRLRWIREDDKGNPAMPNQQGEWRLIVWVPIAIVNRAEEIAERA